MILQKLNLLTIKISGSPTLNFPSVDREKKGNKMNSVKSKKKNICDEPLLLYFFPS